MINLSRLTPLNPHEAWPHEAHSFTPWLACEDNLRLLGDTIGLELECKDQECAVGPFRADILCRDTANGSLGPSESKADQRHLRQPIQIENAIAVDWRQVDGAA